MSHVLAVYESKPGSTNEWVTPVRAMKLVKCAVMVNGEDASTLSTEIGRENGNGAPNGSALTGMGVGAIDWLGSCNGVEPVGK